MFFCKSCATEKGWLGYFYSFSYGECEICNRVAGCADVPSTFLSRIPKNAQTTKEAEHPPEQHMVLD